MSQIYNRNHVKEAAKAAIDADQSHYTGMSGLLSLTGSERVCQRKYNLDYKPESEVLVTIGAITALFATFDNNYLRRRRCCFTSRTCFHPGYEPIVNLVGAKLSRRCTAENISS